MKYITLEELENRKKILYDRKKKLEKQAEEDEKKSGQKLNWFSSHCINIDLVISEINFLIDYINMKEESSIKATSCVKCKHFIKCRENSKNSITFMCGDFCARFEEGNIEDNKKYFDKFLEKEGENVNGKR